MTQKTKKLTSKEKDAFIELYSNWFNEGNGEWYTQKYNEAKGEFQTLDDGPGSIPTSPPPNPPGGPIKP